MSLNIELKQFVLAEIPEERRGRFLARMIWEALGEYTGGFHNEQDFVRGVKDELDTLLQEYNQRRLI